MIDWSNITISDFIGVNELSKSTELDENVKIVEMVKILSHDEDVDTIPIAEFKEKAKILELLKTHIPHNRIRKKYTLNGKEYNVCNDLSKITTGQYIDFVNYSKNGLTYADMARVISILIIPADAQKYAVGYDIKELQEEIEDYMPIGDGLGFVDFFMDAQKKSIRVLRDFLVKTILLSRTEPMKERIKMSIFLVKNLKKFRDLLNTV